MPSLELEQILRQELPDDLAFGAELEHPGPLALGREHLATRCTQHLDQKAPHVLGGAQPLQAGQVVDLLIPLGQSGLKRNQAGEVAKAQVTPVLLAPAASAGVMPKS